MNKHKSGLSIVKQSKAIREALRNRFKELNLNNNDVVEDAKSYGVETLDKAQVSRFMTVKDFNVSGIPSEENILWLCLRYCIPVKLQVGLKSGKKDFLPEYNEEEALKWLSQVFPNKSKKITNGE